MSKAATSGILSVVVVVAWTSVYFSKQSHPLLPVEDGYNEDNSTEEDYDLMFYPIDDPDVVQLKDTNIRTAFTPPKVIVVGGVQTSSMESTKMVAKILTASNTSKVVTSNSSLVQEMTTTKMDLLANNKTKEIERSTIISKLLPHLDPDYYDNFTVSLLNMTEIPGSERSNNKTAAHLVKVFNNYNKTSSQRYSKL